MTQRRTLVAIIFTTALTATVGISMASAQQASQSPAPQNVSLPAEAYFKNIQVLKGVPASEIIPAMNFMSASLGVNCDFCHVGTIQGQENWDKDDKTEKQTARKMMAMMFDINKANFNSRRQVTCNSCHNGHSQPQATPLVASARPAPASTTAPPPATPPAAAPATTPRPTVDQIIEKNIQALGGQAAIEKLTSRVVKGNLIVGDFKAPVESYDKTPGKHALIIHLPQGDQIHAYDGVTTWQAGPGTIPEEPQPWQIARAKREADLQAALHVKDYFPSLRLGRIEKIGDRDAYLIIGFPRGDSSVRLYFDTQTGLLLRSISVADTPVGLSPSQVDYEDYRPVEGVQIPFRLRLSRLDTTLVFQFDDVKMNVPVDDSKFAKPTGGTGK